MPETGPRVTPLDAGAGRTPPRSGAAAGTPPETWFIASLAAGLAFPVVRRVIEQSGAWMIAGGWAGVAVNVAAPVVLLLPLALVAWPWKAWRPTARRAAAAALVAYAVIAVPRALRAALHVPVMLRDMRVSSEWTHAARLAMRERPGPAARHAAARGDSSFLAVAGTGYGGGVPGDLNRCVIARSPPRLIVGTGVAPDAPTQGVFQRRAEEFALLYNREMASQMEIAPEELDIEGSCAPAEHYGPWPASARIEGP